MHKKRKTSGVHASSCKPTKKCVMKMKETNKEEKRRTHKNVIDGRKPFIRNRGKRSQRASSEQFLTQFV